MKTVTNYCPNACIKSNCPIIFCTNWTIYSSLKHKHLPCSVCLWDWRRFFRLCGRQWSQTHQCNLCGKVGPLKKTALTSLVFHISSKSGTNENFLYFPFDQQNASYSPCFIMTVRKRTITLEQGLIRTWRFPRFSALLMLLRASARTFMRTMMPAKEDTF